MATLVSLGVAEEVDEARSVTLGFSFGDASFSEPYAYVTKWPKPKRLDELPTLEVGSWHDGSFFAAVLEGSDLCRAPATEQRERAQRFLVDANRLSRRALGCPRSQDQAPTAG